MIHVYFNVMSYFQNNYKSSTKLYLFKTDTHVNDTPKVLQEEAGNVSVSEEMLLQIADDCNGRVHWLLDTYVTGRDPDRAKHTIPGGAKFQIRKSGIPGAGLGVWTLEEIPACTMIGPYGGVKKYGADILEKDWIYGWLVLDDVGTPKYVIDAEDPS